VIQQSVSLKYEPSSEPLHISAKQLFLNSPSEPSWRTSDAQTLGRRDGTFGVYAGKAGAAGAQQLVPAAFGTQAHVTLGSV